LSELFSGIDYDQDAARRHLAATAPELQWALHLTSRITQVQDALADGT